MSLSSKLALIGLVIVFPACASDPPSSGRLAQWDQARVTEIAKQLGQACNVWWQALREQPAAAIGSGSAMDEFGMVQRAQVLSEQSGALATELAKGSGHDATLDMFQSLKEVVDTTEEEAQQAELDEPTMDAWAKVADLMRQIAPYYEPGALAQ